MDIMKKLGLLLVVLSLFCCSEQPTRDNPYELSYDLPEPVILNVEDVSLTSKLLIWEYELDNIEGFVINRCDDTERQEGVMIPADQRT